MSADGSRLAIVTRDETEVWDADGQVLWTIPYAGVARLSADGSRLATTVHDGGEIIVFDGTSGAEIARSVVHTDEPISLEFSPDGRRLAATSGTGSIAVWDTETGTIDRLERGHARAALALSFTPDGRTLISAGRDSLAIAWDLAGDRRFGTRLALLPDDLRAYARSQNGQLVTAHGSGLVTITDLATGRPLSGDLGYGPLNAVVLLPDQRTAIVAAESGQLLRVDTGIKPPAGAPIARHPQPIGALALAPDGHTLIVGALDGVLQIDLALAEPTLTGLAETEAVWSLRFSGDGEQLAAGVEDGTARLWSWPDSSPRATLEAGPVAVVGLAFDATGQRLVTGGADGDVVVWDLASGSELRRLRQVHAGFVLDTDFSADGNELISSGTDGTIVVHELSSGQTVGSALVGTPDRWVSFELDSPTSLFAVQEDGSIWSWPLATVAWEEKACSIVGRQLTAHELAAYLPGRSVTRACKSATGDVSGGSP